MAIHTHRAHSAHATHSSQARTAQQLQQYSFQLIVPVVGAQQHSVLIGLHPAKNSTVSHHTGLAFKAQIAGFHINPQRSKRHTPVFALIFAVLFPGIGLWLDLMIHVNRVQWQTHCMQCMKQHGGIDPA